jgi:hypothetical protein
VLNLVKGSCGDGGLGTLDPQNGHGETWAVGIMEHAQKALECVTKGGGCGGSTRALLPKTLSTTRSRPNLLRSEADLYERYSTTEKAGFRCIQIISDEVK